MNTNRDKANEISSIINSTLASPSGIAKEMAKDHRYLQSEFYKLCIAYVEEMASKNAADVDGRNSWAVNHAKQLMTNGLNNVH